MKICHFLLFALYPYAEGGLTGGLFDRVLARWQKGGNGGGGGGNNAGSSCNRGMDNIPCLADLSRAGLMSRDVSSVTENGEQVGVTTVTWSSDARAKDWLLEHIENMSSRMEKNGVRHWDPVFTALLEHHHDMTMNCRNLDDGRNGVTCEQRLSQAVSGQDKQCALDLIKAHAALVTAFASVNVDDSLNAKHAIPESCL